MGLLNILVTDHTSETEERGEESPLPTTAAQTDLSPDSEVSNVKKEQKISSPPPKTDPNKNSKLIEIQNIQSSAKKVERKCNVATSTPRVAEKANRTFSPNSGRGIMQTSQQQQHQKQSKTDPKQKQHRSQPHHGKKQGQQQVTDVNNNAKKLADAPLSTTVPSDKAERQEQVWTLNQFASFLVNKILI